MVEPINKLQLNDVWLCIDEMNETIIAGRVYNITQKEPIRFDNFDMLVVALDNMFDCIGHPQSFQIKRSLVDQQTDGIKRNIPKLEPVLESTAIYSQTGCAKTFLVNVATRQFTNWQGTLYTSTFDYLGKFNDIIQFLNLLEEN